MSEPLPRRSDDADHQRWVSDLLTDDLMQHLDPLIETDEDDPFVQVVFEGLMSDTCGCHDYPPAGHAYPRSDAS